MFTNFLTQQSAKSRLAFLHDFLPQRVHQDGVSVPGTVDDGQLALGQFEVVGKLSVQLQGKK